MIESIKDILIVSDIDGTLLREGTKVSEENRKAINHFTDMGGHFTVCTGRTIEATKILIDGLKITDPSIHINGGYLYDWKSQEVLFPTYISANARFVCKKIVEKFPFCDCHFSNDYSINLLTSGETLKDYVKSLTIRRSDCTFETIPEKVYKYIICCPPDKMREVRAYAQMIANRDIKIMQSSDYFLEVLPGTNSKTNGINKLCDLLHLPIDNVVACGDYENDIEMIQMSGIGVAVDNAQDAVKKAADIVVPPVEENGIASLIEFLLEMYN